MRKKGAAYGPTSFGFQRVGELLVADAAEQNALALAVRLDREGASYREIGRMLTESGLNLHRGAAWHASSVRAVLRSKATTESIFNALGASES